MNAAMEVRLMRVLDKFERLLDLLLELAEEKTKAEASNDG